MAFWTRGSIIKCRKFPKIGNIQKLLSDKNKVINLKKHKNVYEKSNSK